MRMSINKDSRASVRVPVKWRADVMAGDQSRLAIKVMDVSEGGLGILSDEPFEVDDMLELCIAIPLKSKPGRFNIVRVAGRVRYQVLQRSQFCMGLEFSRIDASTREIIRQRVAASVVRPNGSAHVPDIPALPRRI
ncbi:MAG: PilZ domain-containing protein [Betaproteobacteria bacterium]|nr:MAG: PilZ domain-containing protein [Betaproteobacteria bacterium]